MEPKQLEKVYRVHVYETGPDGRVNLHSLFNYMQDIASEHAVMLGFGRDDLMKNNSFWVLSRMFARFSEWPAWNESIIVKTWPCGIDNIFAMRKYELRYIDGRFIGSGSSSWLIIDHTTRKIKRPDELLQDHNNDSLYNASSIRNPVKLMEAALTGSMFPSFKVSINDLDLNLHTNNVNYLRWVTDTYDLNFIMKHRACSAEINYLAEAIFDDEIVIRTSKDEAGSRLFNHSIIRASDAKEICRVRLEWEEMVLQQV